MIPSVGNLYDGDGVVVMLVLLAYWSQHFNGLLQHLFGHLNI